MLATLDELGTRLGVVGSGQDDLLTGILTGVSAQLATAAGRVHAGRSALTKATVTETISVRERRTSALWLSAWPVVSITEIKEAVFGGFDDVDALVAGTDYQLDAATGGIHRIGWWLAGTLTVRAIYPGGYTRCDAWVSAASYVTGDVVQYAGAVYACSDDIAESTTAPPADADHWALAAGEVPLPADIVEAAIQQSSFVYQRRQSLGLTSESVQGASISADAADKLLPGVVETMRRYRRLGG